METEGFTLNKGTFSDRKNFPYGFDRSGDFTSRQADVLLRFGVTLQALENNERLPETKTEKAFLEVCKGNRTPETFIETTWAKYRRLTDSKTKIITAFGSIPKSGAGMDDMSEGFDMEAFA